ncbi:MAG: cell division protein ZapE [Moraxellaceae bacterium]|nr:cell division protein ZapE [Moraxellaceae bacterium]
MSYRILNVPENGVIDAYETQLKLRGYKSDPAQRGAVNRLQQLYTELLDFKARRRNALRKLFIHPEPPKSVYLWGGVGRGKSFIMDCFFEAVPYTRKRRVHFHAFMQEIHGRLRAHAGNEDPLSQVADEVAQQTRLLCFDEFHVSHIAEAMILGRLLEALMSRGVIFVMTSNYPPDGLYPGGLQRQNFLPAIEYLKRHFEVKEVDDGTDYRLRELQQMNIFLVPAGPEADSVLEAHFERIAGVEGHAGSLNVLEREIPAVRLAPGVAWFSFAMLCGGPRSQNDYLEIAREHHTLVVSDIPVMGRDQSNEARRFTWLIDVLYDSRTKLIASAEAEAHALYREGPNSQEFPRTVSRLVEMRSHAYLAEAHRPN